LRKLLQTARGHEPRSSMNPHTAIGPQLPVYVLQLLLVLIAPTQVGTVWSGWVLSCLGWLSYTPRRIVRLSHHKDCGIGQFRCDRAAFLW